jgi:uncharacterized protein (DUF934 family)
LAAKPKGKKIDSALRESLYRKLGVDLTAIESIGTTVALTVVTEVGPDLTRLSLLATDFAFFRDGTWWIS